MEKRAIRLKQENIWEKEDTWYMTVIVDIIYKLSGNCVHTMICLCSLVSETIVRSDLITNSLWPGRDWNSSKEVTHESVPRVLYQLRFLATPNGFGTFHLGTMRRLESRWSGSTRHSPGSPNQNCPMQLLPHGTRESSFRFVRLAGFWLVRTSACLCVNHCGTVYTSSYLIYVTVL